MEKDISKTVFYEDCQEIENLFENCELFIRQQNHFFVGVNAPGLNRDSYCKRIEKYKKLLRKDAIEAAKDARAYTGTFDFGHTSAEWESVISLGIYGLRERISQYKARCEDKAKYEFYEHLERVYSAALKFMARCADFARSNGKTEMADSLINLTKRPPSTLYEAMQTSFVYYTLQQYIDGTILRTMGRIDKLFYPYFQNESSCVAKKLVLEYLLALDDVHATANLPFAIGGTDENGKSTANELSYLLIETYRQAKTSNVKLHILCSDDTPLDLIKIGLRAVREGNNSIVFLSDKKVIESLIKLGENRSDATNYHVVGCYECGGQGEITCSCNARVNIPKAVEYALNNGIDMISGKQIGLAAKPSQNTFEGFFLEFERQLRHLCEGAMLATDIREAEYKNLHSSPILSATYTSALENGGDIYCDNAAKYCNSSVNALGLATATDSLYAIKKLVFDDKSFTLEEFADILRSDWKDQEVLRLRCKNRLAKFGNSNEEVDKIAQSILKILAEAISGKPNKKGGIYRLGLFSIDWRWDFGEKTAASADGRHSGEPLSQNTSATFCADKEGATSHLLSVASLDCSKTPNGTIVDIDLHSSAVKGENGLNALLSSLKTYFDLGGFAVHYNILDTEVLLDAKKYPEKYPNLQVRLCGWNVLFSSLSDKEKEEFILRSKGESV